MSTVVFLPANVSKDPSRSRVLSAHCSRRAFSMSSLIIRRESAESVGHRCSGMVWHEGLRTVTFDGLRCAEAVEEVNAGLEAHSQAGNADAQSRSFRLRRAIDCPKIIDSRGSFTLPGAGH